MNTTQSISTDIEHEQSILEEAADALSLLIESASCEICHPSGKLEEW